MVGHDLLLAVSFGTVVNVLYVAMGIGLVIFFHELGHFAVAKWCDVCVERFSIGFGPVLWRIKRGETEYVLSVVPFGGYVKMLGQDDIDPSQLSSDEIAEDPRSYSSKRVGPRMAIISAGVVMNLITGMFFYAGAYGLGIKTAEPIVGFLSVGKPAWEAGIEVGDRITRINDDRITSFNDIVLAVALSKSDRDLFTANPGLLDGLAAGSAGKKLRGEFARQEIRLPHDAKVVADTPRRWYINRGTTRLFTLSRTDSGVNVSGNLLRIEGLRDGKRLKWNVLPSGKGTGRKIGISPTIRTEVASLLEDETPALRGSAAADLKPAFRDKDVINRIGDTDIESGAQMIEFLARYADQELVFHVTRKGGTKRVEITVPPQRFRTLGLSMDIERISAVKNDSPAQRAGITVGDKLITVNGRDVGKDINPLELPNLLASLHDQDVTLQLRREPPTGEPQTLSVTVRPIDEPGWKDPPRFPDSPLSIPALGIACRCTVNILSVVPGSPADKAGIKRGEQLKQIEMMMMPGTVQKDAKEEKIEFDGDKPVNWAHAVWRMRFADNSPVKLEIVGENGKTRNLEVTPWRNPQRSWYLPRRGLNYYTLTRTTKATGVGNAMALAFEHAQKTLWRIWLTLRSLFTGDLSLTELHGPIGIARAAYSVAADSIARLMLFLGFLSLNLAVINFLPIPVLDGGHMVFLTWEAVTRRKPSERVLAFATYCGLAFVLLLMLTVIFLDLKRIPAISDFFGNIFG